MPVPNTFANATATIPLSQLDANFATTITLGNTAIQLGNTVSTLNNMTLANVTVTSGNVTITNVTVTTANVTTANIATANIATEIVTTSQTLNYGTANAVVYLNGSKVSTTGTALQFDGANLGLAVTPSAWKSNYKVIQFNGTGALWGAGGGFDFLSSNIYVDSTDTVRYLGAAPAAYYRLNNSNGQHIWYSAPSGTAGNVATFTQVLAVERANTLALEGAVSQSGTGITFPATQSASSNANTLDDYEEGTWTPTITAITGSYTTVTSQSGTYTKVGRQVTVRGFFVVSNKGTGTGGAVVSNLPFTTAADRFAGSGYNTSTAITYTLYMSGSAATSFEVYKYDGTDPIVATQGNVVELTYFV